ncbi:MAG: hypothetical protein WBE93_04960, partial [Pseudolabrys sp.]
QYGAAARYHRFLPSLSLFVFPWRLIVSPLLPHWQPACPRIEQSKYDKAARIGGLGPSPAERT